jgi:hypothetical protein
MLKMGWGITEREAVEALSRRLRARPTSLLLQRTGWIISSERFR